MNKHARPCPLLPALAALLLLWGCGQDRDGPTGAGEVADDYSAIDLDHPDGGLTPTDEPALAADPYVKAALAADAAAAADDPLAADPEVARLERLAQADPPPGGPRPRITFLRVTWGMLDAAPDAQRAGDDPQPLDWSGLMRVERGLLIVRRLIDFERPGDHLVRPRIDRHTVAWVSHTGPDHDGLLVQILEPPAAPDSLGPPPPPNRLHFRTGPLSRTFDLAELAGLELTVPVDGAGNAVRFCGHQLTSPPPCPRGFLAGLWRAESDSNGLLIGQWCSLHGRLDGFVRGGFGRNAAGEGVFRGKYLSREGRFRGFVRGTWDSPGPGLPGHFQGHWVDAAGAPEGVLGGEIVRLRDDRPGGFFAGRWVMTCGDSPPSR